MRRAAFLMYVFTNRLFMFGVLLDACIPANVSFCIFPNGFSPHTYELHQLSRWTPLLGKICDSTAITSPGRILTLFFLSHFTCFYRFFSWLNWISGPAADFGSISLKKKHGYFSTCSQLGSQQPEACLRYVLFALLEMDNDPFASVLSYLDNRSVHVSH